MKRWTCLGIGGALAAAWVCMVGSAIAQEKSLKGAVKCDGSSTVYLITEAVASNFKKLHPDVATSIGISGTGGGFRKFAGNEIDICDASRKIKPAEADACKKNGVEFLELQVAWDGLALVTNKKNDFATKLTMDQLKKIWHPDSKVKTWKDVDSSFPDETIQLWGAGKDSGTFDYFTEAVNGKEKLIRQDYKASEDDNVLVTGVSKNIYAMGFFGVAYYTANKNVLNVVSLAKKEGDTYYEPTEKNVLEGKYPISRPLFIYVNKNSLARDEVREFVDFYLRRGDLSKTVGYVPMSTLQTVRVRNAFKEATK